MRGQSATLETSVAWNTMFFWCSKKKIKQLKVTVEDIPLIGHLSLLESVREAHLTLLDSKISLVDCCTSASRYYWVDPVF